MQGLAGNARRPDAQVLRDLRAMHLVDRGRAAAS
jgi:hypothetical protein